MGGEANCARVGESIRKKPWARFADYMACIGRSALRGHTSAGRGVERQPGHGGLVAGGRGGQQAKV